MCTWQHEQVATNNSSEGHLQSAYDKHVTAQKCLSKQSSAHMAAVLVQRTHYALYTDLYAQSLLTVRPVQ